LIRGRGVDARSTASAGRFAGGAAGGHPSGGGHWICVIGFDDTKQTFYVNDPWGEIDHLSGHYIKTNGAGLAYSYNLLRKRWTVEGAGTGWWIDLG
jgi:hypothetical protein